MSYADDFVPLPERKPRPRTHAKNGHKPEDLHAISFCSVCGVAVLFACDFRTKSKHDLRAIRTYCSYTEVRKHKCREW